LLAKDDCETERQALQELLESTRQDRASLEAEVRRCRDEGAKAAKAHDDLQGQAGVWNAERGQLLAQVGAAEAERGTTAARVEKLTVQLRELQSELEQQRERETALENALET